MRAALLLLIASAVQAQPFIGNEVVWRTPSPAATYSPSPQAARIEPDGDGYVVAWSEVEDGVSRAYAGRLDGAGRLETVGVHTAGVADAPAIASFGGRYIVAWVEPGAVDARPSLVIGALDRDFKLIGARPLGLTSSPPIVRTEVVRAYVASGNFLYEVDVDGAPLVVYDVPHPLDDMAAAGDQLGYVFHSKTPLNVVGFTWLYRLTTGRLLSPIDLPAAVASNGSSFLVIWNEASPRRLDGSLFGTSFKPFTISTRVGTAIDKLEQPQAAWDGSRWLVVWPRGDTIEAAVIGADLSVKPFTLSARGRRPAVASGKPGRFVVTYEIVDPSERRLSSRIIDFNPLVEHGRAVR